MRENKVKLLLTPDVEEKIHKILDETPLDEIGRITYWDAFRLIQSLNLGHKPTKEETDEVIFYATYLLIKARQKTRLIEE